MNTFKVVNITNRYDKRDSKFNKTLSIDYVVGFKREVKELRPGDSMLIYGTTLSLNIQKLRMEGLVDIIPTELAKISPKSKKQLKTEKVVEGKSENTKKQLKSEKVVDTKSENPKKTFKGNSSKSLDSEGTSINPENN